MVMDPPAQKKSSVGLIFLSIKTDGNLTEILTAALQPIAYLHSVSDRRV